MQHLCRDPEVRPVLAICIGEEFHKPSPHGGLQPAGLARMNPTPHEALGGLIRPLRGRGVGKYYPPPGRAYKGLRCAKLPKTCSIVLTWQV
jgi:hypothetical protein